MEHILCHDIMSHLEPNHILNNYQYGFRSFHLCEAQLILIVEEIQLALDHQKQVDLLMLHFSKAFQDTVPDQQLLNKLQHYGINGKLLASLANYLAYEKITKGCHRWKSFRLCRSHIWCPSRNCFWSSNFPTLYK